MQWSLWGSFPQGWTPAAWCLLRATGREGMLVGRTQMQHQSGGNGRPIWEKAEPEDWGETEAGLPMAAATHRNTRKLAVSLTPRISPP